MQPVPALAPVATSAEAPTLPVRLYVLSASHSPLSHGARELVKSVTLVARRCLEGGWK